MQYYEGLFGGVEVDGTALRMHSAGGPVVATRLEFVTGVRLTPVRADGPGVVEIDVSDHAAPAAVHFDQRLSSRFYALHRWLLAVVEINAAVHRATAVPDRSFAVIDLETTGFACARHDRILEIAVVQLDAAAEVEDRWTTLVNPRRDVGPTSIHGITARDVASAPTFDEIADAVHSLVAGRIVVAHNARFDIRFLAAAFARIGQDIGLQDEHGLCTMRLARSVLGTASRSLAECCATLGIHNDHAHSALGDAQASAALFRELHRHDHPDMSTARPLAGVPGRAVAAPTHRRETATATPGTWLSRIADRAPAPQQRHPHGDEYLAMLDRALIDRDLSLAEHDQLFELAETFGIERADGDALHVAYLVSLAAAAWEDGIVTEAERIDIQDVAEHLGVSARTVDRLVSRPPTDRTPPRRGFELRVDDRISLTGEMRLSRSEWMARAAEAGLVVGSAVTRRTVLLVAADPDSLGTKARKAREYSIPVVHEETFGALLEAMQSRG
ncbi:DNA polymerase III subunit epsilon [Rhodococcus rhodnii]|uniref:DNA polymerase III n=2 Tax=Rhodococcus rhodnii TaxID=38312 RepID=R7WNE6_9NOCA|nr:exonuclease domain-containing protein [Rhodococcus rhodnii]EOM76831.1 DNA polymerase III [Rhodococcus rhodnii LMG 5362]TXG89793.1 DNA polymerase III subunit epsilon [Rhodococcus rhodnii]